MTGAMANTTTAAAMAKLKDYNNAMEAAMGFHSTAMGESYSAIAVPQQVPVP